MKETKKPTKREQRNTAIAEVMPMVGSLVKKYGLNIVVAVVNRHRAAAQNKRKISELERELAKLKGA